MFVEPFSQGKCFSGEGRVESDASVGLGIFASYLSFRNLSEGLLFLYFT